MKIELKREPLLNDACNYTGGRLHELLDDSISHIKSMILQIVGDESPQACSFCQQGHGLWGKCVRLLTANPIITCCANCHWDKGDGGCTYYSTPSISPGVSPRPSAATPSRTSTPRRSRRSIDYTNLRTTVDDIATIRQSRIHADARLRDHLSFLENVLKGKTNAAHVYADGHYDDLLAGAANDQRLQRSGARARDATADANTTLDRGINDLKDLVRELDVLRAREDEADIRAGNFL